MAGRGFWKYTFRVWKVGLQPLKEHASHMMVGTKIFCHFVVMWLLKDKVVGWIALSHTLSRATYIGSVEVRIYVDDSFKQKGIGYKLMQEIIRIAPKKGIWSLYAAIFSINVVSIKFHEKCGFRKIRYRERIDKDKFGKW